jgi:hypothetical protein
VPPVLEPHSRLETLLRMAQRRGVRRGVYGSSRFWLMVAIGAWGVRRFRRAIGSEPDLVYRGELRPGETLRIAHQPETYEGKPVRSRRRKISA